MSSRYSKPCNLIQSFIYQQYSFHLLQLCVRTLGEITQLIRGAREGLEQCGGPQSTPTGGSGFSEEAKSFSHRWEIRGRWGVASNRLEKKPSGAASPHTQVQGKTSDLKTKGEGRGLGGGTVFLKGRCSHLSESTALCALYSSSVSPLLPSSSFFFPPFPFLFFLGRVLGKECPEETFMLSLGLQKLLLFDCFLMDCLCLGHLI